MDNTFILELKKRDKTNINYIYRTLKIISIFIDNINKLFKDQVLDESADGFLIDNMITIEAAINIYHLLHQVILLKIPGDVVELGCFKGTTSILIQKTLDQFNCDKELHVYDSFKGLPKKSKEDLSFSQGFLKTQKESLIDNFKNYNVKLPKIHEGWFKDTLPSELPKKICFAHLDGDFYSSTKESLLYVYSNLSKGAIVVIDDYCDTNLLKVKDSFPGVKKACDEFFKDKKEKMNVLIAGSKQHGYFTKE